MISSSCCTLTEQSSAPQLPYALVRLSAQQGWELHSARRWAVTQLPACVAGDQAPAPQGLFLLRPKSATYTSPTYLARPCQCLGSEDEQSLWLWWLLGHSRWEFCLPRAKCWKARFSITIRFPLVKPYRFPWNPLGWNWDRDSQEMTHNTLEAYPGLSFPLENPEAQGRLESG